MKRVWRALMMLCGIVTGAVAAGCHIVIPLPGGQLMYGAPPPVLDPEVQIADFSYTPASPVPFGTDLTISARLNKPDLSFTMMAVIGDDQVPSATAFYIQVPLNDYGNSPDREAGDGLYTGQVNLAGAYAQGFVDYPVTCRMVWNDLTPIQEVSAPPLTVIGDNET